MQLHTQSALGIRAVTVTQIQGDMVTIDGSHPLAGRSLNFDVENVGDIRAVLSHGRCLPRLHSAYNAPAVVRRSCQSSWAWSNRSGRLDGDSGQHGSLGGRPPGAAGRRPLDGS